MIIKALAVIMWAIAIGTVTLMSIMIAYVLKQAKWESELKRYTKGQLGVYDRQGHLIETPQELLDQLQGVEQRIAK